MTQHFYAMIMAGGGGTRLWPMSRDTSPKQLLPLVEDRSMFGISVDRLAPLFPPERVYVVTGQKYVAALQADAPTVPKENFIVEPYGKDSGPAAALGLTVIHKRDPEAIVAILTADHHIADKQGFRDVLAASHDLALQGYIVTLGITPTYPATGFGYIRQGEKITEVNGHPGYISLGFTEKPNAERATQFVLSGEYGWNSGMFIWKSSQAVAEFERQQPVMAAQFAELTPTVDTPEYRAKLEDIWERVGKISIDYAVMEGAQNMAVIPVNIGWSDVGSWASLFEVVDLDENGNCFRGKATERLNLNTSGTLVFSDRLTVTIGVQDIIVVDTSDALLICHKDAAQQVKDVVNHLRAHDDMKKYL